jgi:putative ABC transport system substrate-binding protein
MSIGYNAPTLAGRIGTITNTAATLLLAIAASLLTTTCVTDAERATRRVMFVTWDNERGRDAFMRFDMACRSLGLQRRHRVSLEFVGVDIGDRTAGKILDRVIESQPLAIIASSSPILVEAARRTELIPIVFATHEDPIELNITPSIARQPRNLAGISYYVGLDDKMLEVLREAAPHVRRIGYVVNPEDANRPRVQRFFERTAQRHGISWKVVPMTSIESIDQELRDAGPVDAWFVTKVAELDEHRARFVSAIARMHRPTIYPSQQDVMAGGPMAYGAYFDDATGVLARQLDRVLGGVTPSDIPIERPKHFTFVVNVHAAKAASMQLSPELISRADLVR